MSDFKIFELRWTKQKEKEWICARTNIEALMHYLNNCDMSLNELNRQDEVVEVPLEQWPLMIIHAEDSDVPGITFEQYMQGKDRPDIIAGTIY